MLKTRNCVGCGVEIYECMGYCKMGDVLEWFNNDLKYGPPIRELCGKCIWKYQWNESGELEIIPIEKRERL